MKNSNYKKSRSSRILLKMFSYSVILLFSYSFILLFSYSCSRIYDDIEKYASKETIYIDKFDGIERVRFGYERVEIDLLKAGRIPASKIIMNKAKKTVIECPDFTEPNHRRVIDSICSWVNVTGLTQLKDYHITIYTEDEHGNRSLPLVAEVRPYTAENRDALVLVTPSIVESTSAALVEWKERISSPTHAVYGYSWSYTDKNGTKCTGGDKGDLPSFFVENVEKEKNIPITLTFKTVPIIISNGSTTPILDTIDWSPNMNLRLSENAKPAIFLKTPLNIFSYNVSDEATVFPLTFSWVKVPEVSNYTVKFSPNPSFPVGSQTVEKNLGDVGELTLTLDEWLDLINHFPYTNSLSLYWRVTPTESSAGVVIQTRSLTVVEWDNITSVKLKNTEAPFAQGAAITNNQSRVFLAADWISNAAAAINGTLDSHSLFLNGAIGFFCNVNFGPVNPPLAVANAKLYQTVELEAGRYKFDAYLLYSSNGVSTNRAYVVVAFGDDLPNTNNVEQLAMKFYQVPNSASNPSNTRISLEFILEEKSVVSLGFVGSYSPSCQIYFRKIELLWKR